MLTIKKILVPTDLSENAAKVYKSAQQLASRYGAKVDFIHIIPTLHYYNESISALDIPMEAGKDMYPTIQKEISGKMQNLMDAYLEPENKGVSIVEISPKPSLAIAQYAQQRAYDLIVIAAKGQHTSRFLKGSITEKVIRFAGTPVLIADNLNIDKTKQILVPTDGSLTSLKALPHAIVFASFLEAAITLYHVQELHGSFAEDVLANTPKSPDDKIRDVMLELLEDFFTASNTISVQRDTEGQSRFIYTREGKEHTIPLKMVTEKGISAHYAITDYAPGQADLVVMATHGRSGLSRILLGSTTEKVARYLDLPLLTIRPDAVEIEDV